MVNRKILNNVGKFLKAFSLVELMVSLITVALITAAFTPTISKKLKDSSVTVVGLSTKCEQLMDQKRSGTSCPAGVNNCYGTCTLCDKNKCVWCGLSRTNIGHYVDEEKCMYKPCSNNCKRCPNLNECIECDPGYIRNETTKKCDACPAGYYSVAINKCEPCPAGQVAPAGSNKCTPCEAGEAPHTNKAKCVPCNIGQYSLAGFEKCINCPAGTYSSNNGSSQCLDCQPGQYCPGGTDKKLCQPGTYQSAIKQSSCINCPIDHQCPGLGSNKANHCTNNASLGAYLKSANCTSCTDAYANDCTTPDISNSCKPGYYLNNIKCKPCPAGYKCAGGTTGQEICSQNKYSTGSASNCTNCPSGTLSKAGSTSSAACKNCKNIDPNCVECVISNSEYCTKCNTGYYLSSDKKCIKCPSDCTDCTSATQCSSCKSPKVLRNGVCIDPAPNCQKGYYPANMNDPNSCTICPKGYYCTGGSNDKLQCNEYSYTNKEGQWECKGCPHSNLWLKGFNCNNLGSIDKNVSCPKGDIAYYMFWFTATQDRTSCSLKCPKGWGKYSNNYEYNFTINGFTYSGKAKCRPAGTKGGRACAVDNTIYDKYDMKGDGSGSGCYSNYCGCVCAGSKGSYTCSSGTSITKTGSCFPCDFSGTNYRYTDSWFNASGVMKRSPY